MPNKSFSDKPATSGIGRYRSDIQGLRAIAVVSVVLYHSSKAALPGGYIGVDVFLLFQAPK
jgi:peptidoglycan/LPS O-acetylase OafA/YrhL